MINNSSYMLNYYFFVAKWKGILSCGLHITNVWYYDWHEIEEGSFSIACSRSYRFVFIFHIFTTLTSSSLIIFSAVSFFLNYWYILPWEMGRNMRSKNSRFHFNCHCQMWFFLLCAVIFSVVDNSEMMMKKLKNLVTTFLVFLARFFFWNDFRVSFLFIHNLLSIFSLSY